MRTIFQLFIFLLFIQPVAAQEKTAFEKMNELPAFKKGIYLSHQDFIHNRALTMEQLIPNIDSSRVDFFFNFLKSSTIQFLENDSIRTVPANRVWAYFDGKGIYINRSILPGDFLAAKLKSDHEFVRINFFGEISLAYYSQQYITFTGDPSTTFGGMSKHLTTEAILIDLRDGKSYGASKKNLEYLVANDAVVLKEFKETREKTDFKIIIAVKKYNMRHPFFLKTPVE